MYEIEKGIPIPQGNPNKGAKSKAFKEMEVGDSFLLVGAKPCDKEVYVWRQTARNCGGSIAARKVEGGVRIWRTS